MFALTLCHGNSPQVTLMLVVLSALALTFDGASAGTIGKYQVLIIYSRPSQQGRMNSRKPRFELVIR